MRKAMKSYNISFQGPAQQISTLKLKLIERKSEVYMCVDGVESESWFGPLPLMYWHEWEPFRLLYSHTKRKSKPEGFE